MSFTHILTRTHSATHHRVSSQEDTMARDRTILGQALGQLGNVGETPSDGLWQGTPASATWFQGLTRTTSNSLVLGFAARAQGWRPD